MINKDIDIQKIEQLLKSVSDDIEVNAIDLSIGYELKLSKTYEESYSEHKAAALDNLMKMIDNLKRAEIMRNNKSDGESPIHPEKL